MQYIRIEWKRPAEGYVDRLNGPRGLGPLTLVRRRGCEAVGVIGGGEGMAAINPVSHR